MKNAHVVILLGCISVLLCSCNKITVGDITDEKRRISTPFQIVEIRDDIDVKLLHCDAHNEAGTVLVRTGANLINDIRTETEPLIDTIELGENIVTTEFNKLIIANDNPFNSIQPHLQPPQVTVYYDTIYELIFHSNAKNLTTDTLRGYNYPTHFANDETEWDSLAPNLFLLTEGGSSDATVLTNCYKLTTKYIHGTSNIKVKGKATLASTYADYDCHGVIRCDSLDTHIHYITTFGTNAIWSKAYYQLDVKNRNVGVVHYSRYWTTKEEHVWNEELHQYETTQTQVLCPQIIRYNGDYINIWTYNNENGLPGLIQERP